MRLRTDHLYAADAGIQDGAWQIKYDHLQTTCPTYSPFDFDGSWSYNLPEDVNNGTTNVTIRNEWIPTIDRNSYSVNASDMATQGKLIVTGQAQGTTYKMKVSYTWLDTSERDNFQVKTLAIWLPNGFTYKADTCNLGSDPNKTYYSYRAPVSSPHAGGSALVWDFGTGYPFVGQTSPLIDPFPGVDKNLPTIVSEISFEFVPATIGAVPDAVAWITTNLSDVPYTWDSDKKNLSN